MFSETGGATGLLWAVLLLIAHGVLSMLSIRVRRVDADRLAALVDRGLSSSQALTSLTRSIYRTTMAVRTLSLAVALAFGWFAGSSVTMMVARLIGLSQDGATGFVTTIAGYLIGLALFWIIDLSMMKRSRPIGLGEWHLRDDATQQAFYALRSRGIGSFGDIQRELLSYFFHYDEKQVGKVAIPRQRIAGLPASMKNRDAVSAVRHIGFTRFPVFDRNNERVIGIVDFRELIDAAEKEPLGSITDHMHAPLIIEANAEISVAIKEMCDHRARFAVVVDEHGRTFGIVTLQDLLREIVKHDRQQANNQQSGVEPLPHGVVEVDGTTMITQLLEMLHAEVEHAGVETVSSYVFNRLGRKPQVGDTVFVGELHLDVLEVVGPSATRIRARRARHAPPI